MNNESSYKILRIQMDNLINNYIVINIFFTNTKIRLIINRLENNA